MKSLLSALILLLVAVTVEATPPRTMSYQGVLTDNGGTIVPDGTYPMTFRIYTVASGGTELWTEAQSVQVTGGRFDVVLGSVTPLTALSFNDPYWLGLAVDADPEMTPRTELTGAPYSQIARTVEDNAITTSKIASNTAVRTINGLNDHVSLIPGTNISFTPIGNGIQISASGGGGGGNDPGVASVKGGAYAALPTSTGDIVSRTINCPAAGYVLAISSCDLAVSHTHGNPTYALMGTSDVSGSRPSNQDIAAQIDWDAPSGLYYIPHTSHGLYSVSAGNNTFYLVGERGTNGTISVGDVQFTLVYFEQSYGTVSPTLVGDLSNSANESGPISIPRASSRQDVAEEVAELRARLAALEARLRDE